MFFFLKRCSTLNINKVLEALNNRLLEPVTEVQLVGKYTHDDNDNDVAFV